jgi:hypothetical protein
VKWRLTRSGAGAARGVAPGQALRVAAPVAADQLGRSHQPRHPLAADPDAAGDLRLSVDPWGAVGATAFGVDPADLPQQPLVGQRRADGPRRCQS